MHPIPVAVYDANKPGETEWVYARAFPASIVSIGIGKAPEEELELSCITTVRPPPPSPPPCPLPPLTPAAAHRSLQGFFQSKDEVESFAVSSICEHFGPKAAMMMVATVLQNLKAEGEAWADVESVLDAGDAKHIFPDTIYVDMNVPVVSGD